MSAPASRAGAWPIIRAYWVSPDSGPGWRLLAAVIALDLALVWRAARITYWQKDFYDALQQLNEAAFWPQLAALAALGGFEIATLAGALLQAASERRVIVVDGFITTAAALAACELAPNARPYCVFAHHSQERGHTLMLERLHAQALLDLGLRLGEGTGAMLAWPLLQSACAILMATFESAQVSNRA